MICKEPGCERTVQARGLCSTHYVHAWRNGGFAGVPRKDRVKRPFEERFWERVEKGPGSGDCWLWTGKPGTGGYGRISPDGSPRTVGAHCASWIIHHGPIADGQCVLHRCDVRACVRPDHLFLGTRRENNEDRDQKGRLVIARGERKAAAKLTDELVKEIRQRAAGGESYRALADEIGVTSPTISNAVNGKTWAHVPRTGM